MHGDLRDDPCQREKNLISAVGEGAVRNTQDTRSMRNDDRDVVHRAGRGARNGIVTEAETHD